MKKALVTGGIALLVWIGVWTLACLVLYGVLVPASDPPAALRIDPATPRLTFVAMGDSYISGEGAAKFYHGTDRPGRNKCRRAPTAYPVRVADAMDAKLYFVACSGARTFNVGARFDLHGVIPKVQYERSGEPIQIEALKQHPDADVVLLSIGGNDALFSEIVALCAGRGQSCVPQATTWMVNLDQWVQDALRVLYVEVRAAAKPTARIYVSTYPSPFADGVRSCRKVGMDFDEVGFVRTFIERLNDQIRLAAEFAGFGVIDMTTSLQNGGLCATGGGRSTLNGWRIQKPDGFPSKVIDVFRGSFHPTEYGHGRMAATVLKRLRHTPASSPTTPAQGPPDRPSHVPPGGPLGVPTDVPPGVPPGLPPWQADEYGPPLPPFQQDENPCTPTAVQREDVEHTGRTDRLTGAAAGSLVCFRTHKGQWHTTRADSDGRAIIRFSAIARKGGNRRVLYRNTSGDWVVRILRPGPSAPPPDVSMPKSWITSRDVPLLLAIAALLLVTYVAAVVLVRRIELSLR